jgi:hypothetical protein
VFIGIIFTALPKTFFMADDRNRQGQQGRSSGEKPDDILEIDYIVSEWGVTPEEAREALRTAGNQRSQVNDYMKSKGKNRTGRGSDAGRSGSQGSSSGDRGANR